MADTTFKNAQINTSQGISLTCSTEDAVGVLSSFVPTLCNFWKSLNIVSDICSEFFRHSFFTFPSSNFKLQKNCFDFVHKAELFFKQGTQPPLLIFIALNL